MDHNIAFFKAIGDEVRRRREVLNWSQSYLAAIAGVGKKQVQRIEGGMGINFDTFLKIAAALGCQPSELAKVDYQLPVNSDLTPQPRRSSVHRDTIDKIVDSSFMDVPRTVKEVVGEGEAKYHAVLKSAAVSGLLTKLVVKGRLVAFPARIKGRRMYCKKKK